MNRREFCQTTALLFAGSLYVNGSSQSGKRTASFRAQTVFLESWDAENVWQDSPCPSSLVRTKLEFVCRNGCNGVLLVPGRRVVTGWKAQIVSEASRFDLKVFVPICLNRYFFSKIRATLPLSHEAGILQDTDRPAESGGFLLSDKKSDVFGVVLYDSSRCRWTGFALSDVDCRHNSEHSESDSRLAAARWLDYVRLVCT